MLTAVLLVLWIQSPLESSVQEVQHPDWTSEMQSRVGLSTEGLLPLQLLPSGRAVQSGLTIVAEGFRLDFSLRLYWELPVSSSPEDIEGNSSEDVVAEEEVPAVKIGLFLPWGVDETDFMRPWTGQDESDASSDFQFEVVPDLRYFTKLDELVQAVEKGDCQGWILPSFLDEQAKYMLKRKTLLHRVERFVSLFCVDASELNLESRLKSVLRSLIDQVQAFQSEGDQKKSAIESWIEPLGLRRKPRRELTNALLKTEWTTPACQPGEEMARLESNGVDSRWYWYARRMVKTIDSARINLSVQ